MPRSRSLTRFTMRVGLLHFGQSVLLDVSITFLRSAVLAILAMETLSPQKILDVAMFRGLESSPTKLGASGLPERRTSLPDWPSSSPAGVTAPKPPVTDWKAWNALRPGSRESSSLT